MGAALDAVGDVITALRHAPMLIAGATIAGVILLLGVLLTFIPLVGQVIYNIVIVPLVLAGMVAMSNAAIDGGAGIGTFFDGIGEYGSDAIGAYAILFVIQFAALFGLLVVAFAVGIGVFAAVGAVGGEPGNGLGAATGGGVLVFAVALLLVAVVMLILGVIQNFLDVAVVIGGEGGMDAVRESVALVTDDLLSTLGYLLVRAAVTLVAAVVPLALFGLGVVLPAGGGNDGVMAGAGIVFSLLGALSLPFPFAASFAYHAGYYRRRRGASSRADSGASSGNERRSAREPDPMGD